MAVSTLPEIKARNRSGRPTGPKSPGGSNAFRAVLGILLVVFLGIGLYRMFAKPPEAPTISIVAAGKDLPPGCKIGFRDLHYMNVPKSYYADDMVMTYPDIVGSYTRTFVPMGEPLRKSQFLAGKQTIESLLTARQRALTLRLDDDLMVDHAVRPGDVVDIIVTSMGNLGKKYTKTVCQNVPVLMSTPKEVQLSDKLKSSEQNKITLALSPADVEKITQAAETSKIRLVLRNSQNHSIAVLEGADERDLLPHEALRVEPPIAKLAESIPAPPAPPSLGLPPFPSDPVAQEAQPMPAPIQWVVDVFKGAKKESETFEPHQ